MMAMVFNSLMSKILARVNIEQGHQLPEQKIYSAQRMGLDFLSLVDQNQLALTRNQTLELQVKTTYQLNKSFDYYFYRSLQYLKSLKLSDMRRKLEDTHKVAFLSVISCFGTSIRH